MTCIIGIVDKKTEKVFIGADSAGLSGYDITIRKDSKIFQIGDFIIGCTSSFRMIQLLRFSLKLPEVKGDIYEYMCVDFVNAVRECFKQGGYLMRNSDGDEKGGQFLVGYAGRLFKIEVDFQVAESSKGINACGCGAAYAMGAAFALGDQIPTGRRVRASLAVASTLSAGVCGPFKILTTK